MKAGDFLKEAAGAVLGIIGLIVALIMLLIIGLGGPTGPEIIFGTIMPAYIGLAYLYQRGKNTKKIAEYREWEAGHRTEIEAAREAKRQAEALAARREANTARIRRLEAQGEAARARVAVLEAHLASAGVALPGGRGA